MFVDHVSIKVNGGAGGRGCVAFRREKGVPKGGPNGGDGGRGGAVVLVCDMSQRTLIDFHFRPLYKAGRGEHGMGSGCDGKDAEDYRVGVPPGTIVRDHSTGETLGDLVTDGQTLVVANGGKGGRGNRHFATPTKQAPYWAETGEPGETRQIDLELRLLADVGLVGLPNAGKSLLLSKISAAHPKVADYPFTTREPQLGVVSLGAGESFVVADLPGLIEGAHRGVGLGHEFLRHASRTRVIVHMVDVGTEKKNAEICRDYEAILEELGKHDPDLLDRPRILAANKMDMPGAEERMEALRKFTRGKGIAEFVPLSALTGRGVDLLARKMQHALSSAPVPELKLERDPVVLRPKSVARVKVVRDRDGLYLVRGKELERVVAKVDSRDRNAVKLLRTEFARLGVDDALAKAGVRRGDRVMIGELVFEYSP